MSRPGIDTTIDTKGGPQFSKLGSKLRANLIHSVERQLINDAR